MEMTKLVSINGRDLLQIDIILQNKNIVEVHFLNFHNTANEY